MTWKGTSKVKVYDILGWDFLSLRRWFGRILFLLLVRLILLPPQMYIKIKYLPRDHGLAPHFSIKFDLPNKNE